MDTPSAIMIKLPEVFGVKDARKLRRELKSKLASLKPCVVVDLSRVKKIDLPGLEGLLDCMEDVAKQDGSLELGGISPEAEVMLELTRMSGLFQKFPTAHPNEVLVVASETVTAGEPDASGPTVQPQIVAA